MIADTIGKTAVAVTAIVAFGAATAVQAQEGAQPQTDEQLLACDRMTNPEERLACFNAVVVGLKKNTAPTAESPPAAAEVPESPVVPDPALAPSQSIPVAPAAGANDVADLPPSAPATANSDFGLEDEKARAASQKKKEKKKNEDAKTVRATIVDVWPTIDGRFEAQLDNGQVWRETEGTRTVRMPKVGSSVRITRGRLGSYRMKINDDNRLAAVRRTK